ncbi:MAG: DUF362 domain-containing protein [Planctomycetes bacterium]|nr:DUF362 domain-containing protein [Planctomycetota bacterium]
MSLVDHPVEPIQNSNDAQAGSTSQYFSRRELLGAGVTLAVGGALAAGLRAWHGHEAGMRADVFIGKATSYNDSLVFRDAGAAEIFVAEGQGHRRDSILVLEESGMDSALQDARLDFVDLNHDECFKTSNAGRWSKLESLYLPASLLQVDFIVSMPKLKTHHWAGVTCAMKNLFGVMPGVVYGWPKNVLHYAGISESILDINATVQPHLAIVDAIVAMEGDGPIMGTPKQLGAIIMGRNLPAVDATCVRLMGLNPSGVTYLPLASGKLGPIREQNITQRGERIASLQSRFKLIDAPHLRNLAGA